MTFVSMKPQATLCDACPLKSRRLCQRLQELSGQFGPRCLPRLRTVEAETRLHDENEHPQFSGVLRRGYLRAERILRDGRRSVLSFLAPGDLIGDAFASVRSPALVAATNVEYCSFDTTTLRRVLEVDARLNFQFLAEATKQHTRQLEMVWRRGALNSRERIIAFMVMAVEFMPTEYMPDGSIILTVKVSRKDWADFANTTVETICRTLAYLAEKGMVATVASSRYRIRDLGALAQISGIDPMTDRNTMLVHDVQSAKVPYRAPTIHFPKRDQLGPRPVISKLTMVGRGADGLQKAPHHSS